MVDLETVQDCNVVTTSHSYEVIYGLLNHAISNDLSDFQGHLPIAAVDKISCDIVSASRGPSALAELFVLSSVSLCLQRYPTGMRAPVSEADTMQDRG